MAHILVLDPAERLGAMLIDALSGRHQVSGPMRRLPGTEDAIRHRYDIIVMDVSLHRKEDWETLKRICKYRPVDPVGPKVVAVSTVDHGSDPRFRARALGSQWVSMLKPDRFDVVLEAVDDLVKERSQWAARGPQFTVRRSKPNVGEYPAGEITDVWLVHRGQYLRLPFSPGAYLLFDYLGNNRWHGRTASRIQREVRSDSFYANRGKPLLFSRSSVRAYVRQIRNALTAEFTKRGIAYDANKVLRSEETTGNEIEYRLYGSIEWVHLDPALLREPSALLRSWPEGLC